MRITGFLISLAITIALVAGLSKSIFVLPPAGPLLSPFIGFWQNAETNALNLNEGLSLKGLNGEVKVHIDERRVPHIFAQNEEDLYFAQGYVTARDRLWQMDFFSYAAAGRVSEIIGDKGISYDRTQRRLGIPQGAQQALSMMENDPASSMIVNSYAAGVNAYINSLQYKDFPVEYKLMGYAPEKWTPIKTAILLKFMSKMLTSREHDLELTKALQLLDKQTLDILFPDFPEGIDPIVSSGTAFPPASENPTPPAAMVPASAIGRSEFEMPESDNIGSNNWAVAGSKTASGYPILCNDPHLALQLPSLWYEMQLSAPGMNVYGVTIPGAPCIIIGFNDKIAWGSTNASRDVKDWYRIKLNEDKSAYRFDGQWRPTRTELDTIRIKGMAPFVDTLLYTHHGPIMYDGSFSQTSFSYPLAVQWTAHQPSNELLTFYGLNKAQNYNDYIEALNHYECPAQNFVFASTNGDIAIKEQGKFPIKWAEQGKFIQDGSSSAHDWKNYIPFEQNPLIKNPERGFVSSANQHPTDSTYPYYYNGIFEYYRNRRINASLSAMENITADDMKALQQDNFNLMAQEILPFLLYKIDLESLTETEKGTFDELAQWNYNNDGDLFGPTYFDAFWDTLYSLIWDEFLPEEQMGLEAPGYYSTTNFLINYPEHELMDNKHTEARETDADIINQALKDATAYLENWQNENFKSLKWSTYKATRLEHWARLAPFNVTDLPIGGDRHVINAATRTHGPSWRMVVELGKEPQAWGIYPGGQSGNPGSPYYANFAMDWAKGKYYPLLFMQNNEAVDGKIIFTQSLKP